MPLITGPINVARIVFTLRHGDSAGVESDDATTAAAVREDPDKVVGAYSDPRRPDCVELSATRSKRLGLKGVKYVRPDLQRRGVWWRGLAPV